MTKNRRPTRSTAKTLRRTQVLAYLRAHPDFFVQAGSKTNELLERMILPSADQGNSISLLGYQNRLLAAARDKWIAERQRILDLTATNRVLMEKIHTGCLHLLHTTTLKDFCQQLDTTLIQELHVEHYAFILFTRAPASSFYRHVAQTTMPRAARQLLQKTALTHGRTLDAPLQLAFFTKEVPWAASYLCVPLHAPRRCLGGLCILSADAKRFSGEQDMHLIEFFQAIIALTLHRCLTSKKT